MIFTRSYTEPPICEKEILRYAGCKSSDEELLQLSDVQKTVDECIEEVRQRVTYKVCYVQLPVTITENICDFGCIEVASKDLAKNLKGCKETILFAATIGVEIDRLIAKYSRISPTKALIFQAIGAERIEALCDAFCEDIEREYVQGTEESQRISFKPRFSPGYGDVPLETQKDIFKVLECSKKIGISLNDSLLMSPTKSVTAFVGLTVSGNEEDSGKVLKETGIKKKTTKCATCNNVECVYREI